jgi:hypothetical protein
MSQIPIPTSGQQTPLRTADHGRTDGRPAQGLVRFLVFHPRAGVIVLVWIALNLAAWMGRWDPYPFILLNLVFSTQAAYAAPLLLLSQNRQAERDRVQSEHDFRVNHWLCSTCLPGTAMPMVRTAAACDNSEPTSTPSSPNSPMIWSPSPLLGPRLAAAARHNGPTGAAGSPSLASATGVAGCLSTII